MFCSCAIAVMNNLFILYSILALFGNCNVDLEQENQEINSIAIDAVTVVATPDPIDQEHIDDIHIRSGADWLCLVPYGFTRQGGNEVLYNLTDKQWWGETEEGVLTTIEMCRNTGSKIILKPQVWSMDGWSGEISFTSEDDWKNWERTYTDFIVFFAEIAEREKVELLVIGTELKEVVRQRPSFWFGLIEKINSVYSGKITYASNWDNYQNIPFWKELDMIGIDAYFPLTSSSHPILEELKDAWDPIEKEIASFSKENNRPVLFTEFGYLSVDGCAYNTWELEKKIMSTPENQVAQANAYEALLSVFSAHDFWLGGIVWKWFPNEKGHEGYFRKDYTPQHKLAEKVLHRYYTAE